VGKSRLAAEAASVGAGTYPHGSHFAALEGAIYPDQVATAIGTALDFNFLTIEDQGVQLAGFLRDKELLLVLDDMAHLSGGPALVRNLLAAAPGVRILVSAGKALGLKEEREYSLSGLTTLGSAPSTGQGAQRTVYLSDHDLEPRTSAKSADPQERRQAARLFIEFAREVRPEYAPPPAEEKQIEAICSMLDGMPLSLKLAAPWTRIISPEEMQTKLTASLKALTAAGSGVGRAQAGLLAVLDLAWSLLPQARRETLAKLSVFQGSFSERAAKHVAEAAPSQLAALLDKAMLVKDEDGKRYAMHPEVRRYAGERLHQIPEMEAATRERCIVYYSATLRELEPTLKCGEEPEVCGTLDEICAEIWNLRAAWEMAVRAGHEEGLADALESLFTFYELRGLHVEGERQMARASESLRKALDGRGETLGRVLTRQAHFCTRQGRYGDAVNLLQEALVYLTGIHAPEETAYALRGLGTVAYLLGKHDEAAQFAEEARNVCGELDEGKRIWTTAPTLSILDLTSVPG
jgi:predicted ATPase